MAMVYLPEELLTEIFAYFTVQVRELQAGAGDGDVNATNQCTLASLCKCNKTFSRLARPLLYQAIDFSHQYPRRLRSLVDFFTSGSPSADRSMGHVRELRLGSVGPRDHKRSASFRHSHRHMVMAVRRLPVSAYLRGSIEVNVSANDVDALLVLLVSCCPRLQTLAFAPADDGIEDSFLVALLADRRSIVLPMLRTLIADGQLNAKLRTPVITPFMSLLPVLQHRRIEVFERCRMNCTLPKLPQIRSNDRVSVRKFVLQLYHIHEDSLEVILAAWPHLEPLTLQEGSNVDDEDWSVFFEATGNILRKGAKRLRHLQPQTVESHKRAPRPFQSNGSFVAFDQLETVSRFSVEMFGAIYQRRGYMKSCDTVSGVQAEEISPIELASADRTRRHAAVGNVDWVELPPQSPKKLEVTTVWESELEMDALKEQMAALRTAYQAHYPNLRTICLDGREFDQPLYEPPQHASV